MNPLYKWLAVGGVIAGLAVYGYVQGLHVDLARAVTAQERADAAAEAAKVLEAAAQRADAAIAERDAKISELEGRKAEIVREIVRVPVTTQCVNSPAVGTVLRGLRRDTGPDGAGSAPGAGSADRAVQAAP